MYTFGSDARDTLSLRISGRLEILRARDIYSERCNYYRRESWRKIPRYFCMDKINFALVDELLEKVVRPFILDRDKNYTSLKKRTSSYRFSLFR